MIIQKKVIKRLNLSCGNDIRKGYINIDLYNQKADLSCDVRKLPYKDGTIDEIFASHIIEHFNYYEAKEVLKEWKRVLKKGGKLIIETPDFLESCKKFVLLSPDDQPKMFGHFFAKSWVEGETHKFLYTKRELYITLTSLGFIVDFEEPTMHILNPNIRAVCTF